MYFSKYKKNQKKKDSIFYFFGSFNDYPYDIRTRYVDVNMKKKYIKQDGIYGVLKQ